MGLVHSILSALFPPQPVTLDEVIYGRPVTVRGVVVARDLLESPLDGTLCVYYHYSVQEWRQSQIAGLPDGYWTLAEHDEAIAEFYLHDGTGRAIVAPHGVRIQRAKGVNHSRVDLGVQFRRAQQLVIRPGDVIEVEGVADRVDDLYDDARDYRARAHRALLRAPDGGELTIRILPEQPVASRDIVAQTDGSAA